MLHEPPQIGSPFEYRSGPGPSASNSRSRAYFYCRSFLRNLYASTYSVLSSSSHYIFSPSVESTQAISCQLSCPTIYNIYAALSLCCLYPSPSAQHNGEKRGRRHFIRAVKALDAALLYCNPGTNLRFALAPVPLMHLSCRLATISRNFCDLLSSLPFQILLGMLGVLLEEHGTVYTVLLMRIAGYHFYKSRHNLEVATRDVSGH